VHAEGVFAKRMRRVEGGRSLFILTLIKCNNAVRIEWQRAGKGMARPHSHPHLQAVTSLVLMTFLTNILPEQSTQGALV